MSFFVSYLADIVVRYYNCCARQVNALQIYENVKSKILVI